MILNLSLYKSIIEFFFYLYRRLGFFSICFVCACGFFSLKKAFGENVFNKGVKHDEYYENDLS